MSVVNTKERTTSSQNAEIGSILTTFRRKLFVVLDRYFPFLTKRPSVGGFFIVSIQNRN